MRLRGKKVLAVCQKGNSRSVTLAYYLKRERKADAIAIGIEVTKPETFDMLCNWSDLIMLTDTRLDRPALDPYRHKLIHVDVGTDIWFKGFDKGLLQKFRDYLA